MGPSRPNRRNSPPPLPTPWGRSGRRKGIPWGADGHGVGNKLSAVHTGSWTVVDPNTGLILRTPSAAANPYAGFGIIVAPEGRQLDVHSFHG